MESDALRPELKGQARLPFQDRNSGSFARARGETPVVEQLSAIHRRADRISDRLRKHCQKFEESWVAKEAIQIWNKRTELSAKHPAPDGAPNIALDPQVIMQQARRTVRARMTKRLSNVNQTRTRMENAVLKNANDNRREHAPKVIQAFDQSRQMKRRM